MPGSFYVQRDNLAETIVASVDALVPDAGEVVIAIERFALTANNITYGVAGDLIGYWNFFPAPEGLGRIPVWGIGCVTQSAHPDITEGNRYYGYFPMSEELCVKPEKVNARGFKDGVAHRVGLPAVYNQYSLVSSETGFDPAYENHAMLYRPLFTTSYVLDDYLLDNEFFAATTVLIASASSKTGFGLAYMLDQRPDIQVVGLTSKTNSEFVEGLALYDRVLTYEEVESLGQDPSVYVDMAGNRGVLARVHHHLGDLLVCSCGVGITHWDAREGEDPTTLPGAKPTMFFAPTQIMKRNESLGAEKYQQMIGSATQTFFQHVDDWVTIETIEFGNVEQVYKTVLNGPPPNKAYIVVT